jgi:hypothetical protein
MKLKIEVPEVNFSPFNLKINYPPFNLKIDCKRQLYKGDLVKILDDKGDIIEYAYLLKDIYMMQGYPFAVLKLQRNNKILEMVITDAIQKV